METQLLEQQQHPHPTLGGPGDSGNGNVGASGASITQQLADANALADTSDDIIAGALSGNAEMFVQHFRQAGGQ